MALHMSYNENGGEFDRTPAPDGLYKVRLKEVKEETSENIFETNADGSHPMRTQLVWAFETVDAARSDGKPYMFWKRTGTDYGNDKANLTLLIDAMLGKRMTGEEAAEFDLQSLEGNEYNALVSCQTNQRGELRNKLLKVSSLKPAPTAKSNGHAPKMNTTRPAAPVPPDTDDDLPRLTPGQRAALAKRLKLTDEEAKTMDEFGRMPDDDGYDPFNELAMAA